MKRKVLSGILMALLALGFLTVFPYPASATDEGTFYMVPTDNIFFTNETHAGDTFTVTIMCQDVVEMFSWQVALTYNSTLLEVTAADIVIPPNNVFAGMDSYAPPPSIEPGYLVVAQTLMGEYSFTGSGPLVEITFHIIYEPERKQSVSCPLHFVTQADPEALKTLWTDVAEADHYPITEDGYYEFSWAPPAEKPYYSVSPSTVTMGVGGRQDAGKHFTIDVLINNVNPDWLMIGGQFVLYYNSTLLNYVGATEGDFFSSFAPYGTWSTVEHEDGALSVGIMILPNETGYWDLTTWPSGSGVVFTFEFEVAMQEEFPWEAEAPFDLEPLFDICFIDVDGESIPYQPPVDGVYHIYGYILGLQLDVYTQYDEPYGGQGPNMVSDMFAPQAEVILYAKLLYNLDPLQQKLVTFQIVHGEFNFTLIGETNADGIANVTFRIPWPCVDPEARVFGIWNVTATAEVAEQVVEDHLAFIVDYPVKISVTPKQVEYTKYKDNPTTMEFTITYETYSMQPIDVLLTASVFDELNFFIGSTAQFVTAGWGEYGHFNEIKVETLDLAIPMPSHAVVGTATVKANALTDWPWVGGTAYCPEASATFRIIRP